MRHFIHICTIAIMGLWLTACNNATTRVDVAEDNLTPFIKSQLDKYPYITLQDFYKGCFQDYFGPAHIISDTSKVYQYITYELSTIDSISDDYFEPCYAHGNYYRVSLSVIRDSIIPINAYTDAFIRSTLDTLPSIDNNWIDNWNKSASLIKKAAQEAQHHCLLNHFEQDSIMIDSLLRKGEYVVHHSNTFNRHHHPHYRIIRSDIFEKEILPLISAHIQSKQPSL